MRVHKAITVGVLTCTSLLARPQGCSDAGVCTAGPIGELPITLDSTLADTGPAHYARLTFSYAVGEQSTTILQGIAEVGVGITSRLSAQLRLPYLSASGNLGDNSGIGDPTVTASYVIFQRSKTRLEGMLGAKFPVNDANAQADGLPLPMPYQTSLGTTDLLLGMNYRRHRWSLGLAYQHVLDQRNENGFLHKVWMDDMDALGYFESFALERANDAVARLQYALPIGRLSVQPGLLAIYHLSLDSRMEISGPAIDRDLYPLERREVEGSDGLTLNVTVDARWNFAERLALELAFGSPVITREARPDGLTRQYVVNAGLRFAF